MTNNVANNIVAMVWRHTEIGTQKLADKIGSQVGARQMAVFSSGGGITWGDGGPSRPSWVTGAMVYGLIVVAFLAPLPLGSNRPVAWAAWAGVIGLGLGLHLILVRGRGLGQIFGAQALGGPNGATSDFAMPRFASLGLAVALALVLPFWGVVQMVPGLGAGLGLPAGAQLLAPGLAGDQISLAPGATGLAVMRMLAHVGLFVLVLRLISRASRADLLLHGLFFGITLHAIWAMVNLTFLGDAVVWGEKTAYLGVATGPFVNRNSFAAYLGMGLVLGVVLLMDRDHRPRLRMPHRRAIFAPDNLGRLAIGLCALLIFVTLLASQSRAGLGASVVGAGVAALVMGRASSLHSRSLAPPQQRLARRILSGFVGLAVLAILAQGVGMGVLERGIFTAADWGARGEIYANALARIAERPLTGYGLDAFPLAYELGRSAEGLSVLTEVDAHSTYLENWVDGGVIFGSALLVAGLVYLRHLLALMRQAAPVGAQSMGTPVGAQSMGTPVGAQSMGTPVGAQSMGTPAGAQSMGTPAGAQSMAAPVGAQSMGTPVGAQARPPALAAAALGVLCLAGLHSLFDFSFEIEANVMILVICLALGVAPLRQKTRRL